MYNEPTYTRSSADQSARLWAFVAFSILAVVFIFGGFGIAMWLGGKEWARWYGVAVGVLVVLAALYGGIYATMALLARFGHSIAQANADLLHAHATSGAQQARAVTEVVRGVNQMNAADAKTQQAILSNYASLGAKYEARMAELVYRAQQAEARAQIATAEPDDTPRYALPLEGEQTTVYKLPKVS